MFIINTHWFKIISFYSYSICGVMKGGICICFPIMHSIFIFTKLSFFIMNYWNLEGAKTIFTYVYIGLFSNWKKIMRLWVASTKFKEFSLKVFSIFLKLVFRTELKELLWVQVPVENKIRNSNCDYSKMVIKIIAIDFH